MTECFLALGRHVGISNFETADLCGPIAGITAMSDQIDISREVCNEMAFRLHRLGEYEVAQLEGYSLWPFADIILALRAALDAAIHKGAKP